MIHKYICVDVLCFQHKFHLNLFKNTLNVYLIGNFLISNNIMICLLRNEIFIDVAAFDGLSINTAMSKLNLNFHILYSTFILG